jgi:hypothetical protein
MKPMSVAVRREWSLAALVLALAVSLPSQAGAQPVHVMYGLVKDTADLVRFSSTAPNVIEETFFLSGVLPGETLRAIDFRPANGELYALATNDTTHVPRLYLIDLVSRKAFPRPRTVIATNMPADWSMAFSGDRPRVISTRGDNRRVGPESGQSEVDTDMNSAQPPPPIIDGIAADRQFATPTQTTLFGINRATNSLAYIGGLNGQTGGQAGGVITDIGPLGVNVTTSQVSLDIASNGAMFAAIQPNAGVPSLYSINPANGAAAPLGTIGDGTLAIEAMAIWDPSITLSPANGTYTATQRWDMVIVANLFGRGLVSGQAFLDGGVDVTSVLAGCVIPGTVDARTKTLRCPGILGAIFTPGRHRIDVTLVLTDGAEIKGEVFWNILPGTEP